MASAGNQIAPTNKAAPIAPSAARIGPAMLGLRCTLLAVGLCGRRSGVLPKWLSVVSIVLGVASPPARHPSPASDQTFPAVPLSKG